MFPPTPRRLLRRQVALPSDHGAWVFLLSPLIIGVVTGGRIAAATPFVILGALAAFLLRQPTSMLVKAYSGRRSRDELPAARLWMVVYGTVAVLAAARLAALGLAYLLYLVAPAIPLYAWHLVLVSRRAERRQMGVELAGSGVLALVAPAAMWAGMGQPDPRGWWLWGLVWFQSAASIVYAYLRLEQRSLPSVPKATARLGMGWRALACTTFNLWAVCALSYRQVVPPWLFLPYLLQWLESLWGTLRPAIGARPSRIGLRQLAVSSLFTALFVLAWSF